MSPEHPDDHHHEGRFSITLSKVLAKLRVEDVPHIKRIVVTIIGGTVMIFGALLIVTPVPGALIIPAGLAILGTEYAWARRWLRTARAVAAHAISKTQSITRRNKPDAPTELASAKNKAPPP